LPIRSIDFGNSAERRIHDEISQTQERLIDTYSEIDKSRGDNRFLVKLNREFEDLKLFLEKRLKELYDLGQDDALIPLIKELYR
jgi:hypothetical protein